MNYRVAAQVILQKIFQVTFPKKQTDIQSWLLGSLKISYLYFSGTTFLLSFVLILHTFEDMPFKNKQKITRMTTSISSEALLPFVV